MRLDHIEYVAALRAWKEPPESHKKAPPASLAQLRARMYRIGDAIRCGREVPAAEREAYRIWERVRAHERQDDRVRGDVPAPGYRREPRLQVTEPVRKYPLNVQATPKTSRLLGI